MEAVSIVPNSGSKWLLPHSWNYYIRTKPQSRSIDCQEAVTFPKDFFSEEKHRRNRSQTSASLLPSSTCAKASDDQKPNYGQNTKRKWLQKKEEGMDAWRCSQSTWMAAFRPLNVTQKNSWHHQIKDYVAICPITIIIPASGLPFLVVFQEQMLDHQCLYSK